MAPFAPGEVKAEAEPLEARFEHLLETVHRNRPNDDLDLIRRAWTFCMQQHEGQKSARVANRTSFIRWRCARYWRT